MSDPSIQLHGPGGLLATPGMGSRRRKRKWGQRLKDKQIKGNLYRSDVGRFTAGNGSPSDAPVVSVTPKKRGAKKPKKVVQTPDEKRAARAAEQAQNRAKVLEGMNIAPDGQAALEALRSGAAPDPKAIERGGFVEAGLVEQASDGSYRMTASGRAAMAAASAGDAGRAGDTISSARDRLSTRQGKQQAATARREAVAARRVEAAKRRTEAAKKKRKKPEKPASKSFTVYKDHTGQPRWIARTTTAYRDRDGEIISETALDADSQRMTASKQFGPLRYWHVGSPDPFDEAAPWGPGLDIGDCDYSVVIGRTRIESGTFRSPGIAQKMAAAAARHEMSPGFFHPLDQPDTDGVFDSIRTFERSIVPTRYGRGSNLFTGFAVKEAAGITFKAQTPQEKAMFANMGSSGGGSGGSGGKGGLYPKGPSGKRTPQAAAAESRGTAKPEETTDTTDKTLRQSGLITDKKMTPAEATSLQWYQGVGHDRINAELRGSAPVRDQYTLDMTTQNLDRVMDRSKLKRDIEVHRGMYLDTPHAEAQLARMQPGKIIRDPGYVSTTANRDVVRKFGTSSLDIRIRARAGTPAIYMPTASPRRMTSQGSHNEYELLLGRNLKYRVVSRQDSGGATTIELEVVP